MTSFRFSRAGRWPRLLSPTSTRSIAKLHRGRPTAPPRHSAPLEDVRNGDEMAMASRQPRQGHRENARDQAAPLLSTGELARLTETLATFEDQQAANIIRLLLLTGARRGEVQAMKWADLDVD